MLHLRQYSDPRAFLTEAEPWLGAREDEHNLILSVAYLLAEPNSQFRPPFYLATVQTDRGVEGCAVCPPPDGLYLTSMPMPAVPLIVDQLAKTLERIAEVIGPEDVTMEFARLWRPGGWSLHSRMWRYSLESVSRPKRRVPGRLRGANADDLAVLDAWAPAYAREVGTKVDVSSFFRRLAQRGDLYLWDDDGPRCVVTTSGLTKNGARISAVYTPPSFRGNGYAENAVAAASQVVLDGGRRFCVITADMSDPVPNEIYRRLGFERRDAFVQIHFS